MSDRIAVIMAGGTGERFWPASTAERPKQFLPLATPNQTLIEDTLARARKGFEEIYIASTSALAPAIRTAGLVEAGRVFAEPEKRNTLGAVLWATAELMKRGTDPASIVAFLPSDHAIRPESGFTATLERAANLAEEGGLVTIGIPPTRPETGYGYVLPGDENHAARFSEKPDVATAARYLEEGWLWNSGIFVWRLDAFLRELERHVPDAAALLPNLSETSFRDVPALSIDKALMEKSDRVVVVPAQFEWDDLGAWDALDRTHAHDEAGNVQVGRVAAIDARDCVLYAEPGMSVGVIGVEDLVVVATENGVLVCPKSQAQRVREIAVRLAEPD